MTVFEEASAIAGEVAELRHAIHREPEIGLDLPRTQAKVLAALDGLPLEITLGKELSSVTAVLRGGRPGPVVLLRADMDALPVTETTGLPFASEIDGAMHACGHDLHTAMLTGAARVLSARQRDLPGSVIFMFQPGEEGLGGAKLMIEEGVLDAAGERPAAAYALHVFSHLTEGGVFAVRPGPALAAADILYVTVRGRGGHASAPQHSADPIPAACEMVTALQTFVTRRFDVFDPVVITVGSFHAGTVNNVIPDEASFEATLRSFSHESQRRLHNGQCGWWRASVGPRPDRRGRIPGLLPGHRQRRGRGRVRPIHGGELFGTDRAVTPAQPLTGAEDFSYVLNEVPGAFVNLGACPSGTDPLTASSNHSAGATFDDAVIADGITLYAELALRRLGQGA